MAEDLFLLFCFVAFLFLLLGTADKLVDRWYRRSECRLKRPLRVRKITRKEPLTARRAGTVYPDRKEVNEE